LKTGTCSRITAVILLGCALRAGEPAGDLGHKAEELVAALGAADPAARARADQALEALCNSAARPGAGEERRAVAGALASKLAAGLEGEARLQVIEKLQLIGRDESVPSLARLLENPGDRRLWDAARRALEANPAPQAVRALRKACSSAEGEFRAAAIQSLGARRDSLSVGQLLDDAKSDDGAVRMAALWALSRIGDRSATDLFEEALGRGGPELPRVRELYLALADSMREGEEGGAARRIYLRVLESGAGDRATALVGLGRAGLPSDLPVLLAALKSDDPRVRGGAREGLALLRGPATTRAIAAQLGSAGPDLRPVLARVLGLRADPAAAPALLAALVEAPEDLQVPLLEALGRTGGKGALEALLQALSLPGKPRAAAEGSLALLKGEEATAGIAAALKSDARAEARPALARILRARGGPPARGALAEALKDADPGVRAEAYLALSEGGPEAVPILIEAAGREVDPVLPAVRSALGNFAGAETTAAILRALSAAPGPSRPALIGCLAGRSGPGVLAALAEAAKDADPTARQAALEALSRGDESALALLQGLPAGDDARALAISLRGSLRLAELKSRRDDPASRKEAAMIYLRVLERARADDDRTAALRGLGEVAGADALEKVRPHLRGPLAREAGRAAVRLASRVEGEEKAAAVAVYQEILKSDPDPATARDCARRLRRLGVEPGFAPEGMVTGWWLLGPIPDRKGGLLSRVLPPEESIALDAEVKIEGESYRWKVLHADDPRGVVNLTEALGNADDAGAYLYAEVQLDDEAEGIFKLGSDDQVACFLNGKVIHSFPGQRGLTVDEDQVKVRLSKGPNRILLKVVNRSGGWEACLRITGVDGKPLRFRQ
jgi:HEAT repeat protein